ncbi:hypothetical protein [Elioraea sp.]|uniref:hypothetical protein n=1 Tax=Elioraea sp. TaxID=2185103 RepID=UPI0025C26AC3|nr:hypothetical protein [Elioraea sp.]
MTLQTDERTTTMFDDRRFARLRAVLLTSATALVLAAPWAASGHESRDYAGRPGELGVVRVAPTVPGGAEAPRLHGMGILTWRVTANAEAQGWFDQGLNLAWGFNHAEAVRAFRAGRQADPSCAMCFWGEAWALGPNINAPMAPAALPAARAALDHARAVAGGVTPIERALVDALAERYGAEPIANPAAAARAYAGAMRGVVARFPAEREVAVLAADALMNVTPWDYWTEGGRAGKGATDEIIALLEAVLGVAPTGPASRGEKLPALVPDPDHIGAIHLYIHMVEASDRPERALPAAGRLAGLAPAAGHLVHMGSHILYRVGQYRNSLALNRAAVAADQAYIAAARPTGLYPQAYYPHNLHMLLASAQMAGDAETVLATARALAETVTEEAARDTAWVQPIMAAPWFAHAQFAAPEQVLAAPPPDAELPYVQAAYRYARGIAFARSGERGSAEQERARLIALADQPALAALADGGVPAPDLVRLAAEMLVGRIAMSAGQFGEAAAAFARAAFIEDRLPYSEPPFWYVPTRQSLGAALLLSGDVDQAEAVFRDSLRLAPRNGWAIFGMREVARLRNDLAAEDEAERQLREAWIGDRALLTLERL